MITRSIFLEKGFRRVEAENSTEYMTYTGTVNKSILLLTLLFLSSGIAWYVFQTKQEKAIAFMIVCGLVGSLLGVITSFFPKISVVTAPIYTALEGTLLGVISAFLESAVPGIVTSAVLTTFAVCIAVLMLFKSKPSIAHKLRNFIIIATMSIAFLYVLNSILGIVGLSVPFLNDMGPVGICIDLFIILIAAGNLLLDFQLIYEGVNNNAPKYMEWYASFGIMLTLVLMYTKILELLFKLFGKNLLDN